MGVQVIVLVEEAEEVMASLPRIFGSRKKSYHGDLVRFCIQIITVLACIVTFIYNLHKIRIHTGEVGNLSLVLND